MIRSYTLYGNVKNNPGRLISTTVSCPVGITQDEFDDALNKFMIAFENVTFEVH